MVITCSALIFDLDGVLVDSTPVVEKHWRRWAATRGFEPDAIIRAAHGRRTVDTIRTVAPDLDARAEAEQLAREEAPDTEGLRVYDGAAALVRSLPPHLWTVATSGTDLTARTRLGFAGIPVPDALVTADDVSHGKPGPEAYLLAAARLGVDPAECVVVEDAPAGIEAARRAGMRPIGVATTHNPADLDGAVVVVASVRSLSVTTVDGTLRIETSAVRAV